MAKIGDFVKTEDFKNEKHVPVIELPEGAKKGEAFPVLVTVGKEISHPNTTAHYIAWVSLYFKPEGGGPVVHLGKTEFAAHGASANGADSVELHTASKACFAVSAGMSGTLLAVSYCNIHGLWESEMAVSV